MTEATPASWRLFLGLWPTPQVRSQVQANAAAWQWPAGARRTTPDRLHATLHFLGNLALEHLPRLRAACDLPWAGCTLALDRAEVWPGGIAVLEATQVPPALADLHARLAAALRRLDLPVESRPYRPHVTLARKGQGARPPEFAPIEWETGTGFVLVRSLPGGRGYEPVQAFG